MQDNQNTNPKTGWLPPPPKVHYCRMPGFWSRLIHRAHFGAQWRCPECHALWEWECGEYDNYWKRLR